MRVFEEILFAKTTYNTKTNKESVHLSFSGSAALDASGRKRAQAIFLLLASNWRKTSELIGFLLYVALIKGFLKNLHILSFVQLKSILFNLLCILSFFRTLAVNSVPDFLQDCLVHFPKLGGSSYSHGVPLWKVIKFTVEGHAVYCTR